MKTITKLWLLIGILIILSPLGLVIPAYFKSRGAFGEERLSAAWKAPLPDYCVRGLGENAGYILSAIIGIIVIAMIVYMMGKFFEHRGQPRRLTKG